MLVYSRRDADGLWALHKRDRTGELSALDGGTETLVPGVHALGHSETMPTLHHGVLGSQRRRADEQAGGSYRLIALRPDAGSRRVKALRADQNVTGADLSARGLALSTERRQPGRREVSVQVKPSNRPLRTLQVQARAPTSASTAQFYDH